MDRLTRIIAKSFAIAPSGLREVACLICLATWSCQWGCSEGPPSVGAAVLDADISVLDDIGSLGLQDSLDLDGLQAETPGEQDVHRLDSGPLDAADVGQPDETNPDVPLADAAMDDSQQSVTQDVQQSAFLDADATEDVLENANPTDDILCFNHLQALGTHNSYHQSPFLTIPHWAYDHLPLDQQLEIQGVRQFELDLNWEDDGFSVYHVVIVDQGTSCDTLSDCLTTMKDWSDAHLHHHPLHMLFEIKDGYDAGEATEILDTLENVILLVWPLERIITPDVVRGEAVSLNEALATQGWPSLASSRGKIMFVLHEDGDWRDAYTAGGTTTEGRVLFPDAFGDLSLSYAAYHTMNDPEGGLAAIQQVVNAGHLVRTRADSDGEEAFAHDMTRFEKALESGAHFISTDYPAPNDSDAYALSIPEGTPSRCNPLTAPAECVPQAIENPATLGLSP
jgi:hypothetical protein